VKLRTWPILAAGFGSLVLVTMLFGLYSLRRAGQIYTAVSSLHEAHSRTEEALREIESGIYRSSIFVRDFLLDPSQITAGLHRGELLAIRSSMEVELKALQASAAFDSKGLEQMRQEIDAYWDSMDPIFEWTPQRKLALSFLFLRRQVLPRRDSVLKLAGEVKGLNALRLRERQSQMNATMEEFRQSGRRMLLAVLLISLLVAVGSIARISQLEIRAERQHLETETAEQELRRLSQQLVRAQEDERRNISRELHDEVGQTLTALRVELGNLEKLRSGPEEPFRAHMEDAKDLAAHTLQSVRSLAMGLRPAILDDLGLGSAVEWQAREFSRRTGSPVEVRKEDLPDELPERHRTCLYRLVQEALTNCARHAEARRVQISLGTQNGWILLTVRDDGRGLAGPLQPESSSLGLLGMEERVRELGGALAIQSEPGKGTLLKASIPLIEVSV
jgi:signal transduction histidine kinase